MIMLNHAAYVEYENTQKKFEHNRKSTPKYDDENDPILREGGKQRLSDLQNDPEAMDRYFADLGNMNMGM